MRLLLLVICLLSWEAAFSETLPYYNKKREYHVRAIYIDAFGDTISNEIIIIKPMGRPWWPQPWKQKSIRYIYSNDSTAFQNYKDPRKYFRERDSVFEIKGKMRIRPKETIGGIFKEDGFYMHPPRCNQYRMLFYAPHPWIYFGKDADSYYPYEFIRMGRYRQTYNVTILPDTIVNNTQVKTWKVYVPSTRDVKEGDSSKGIYNSVLDAIFTKEYGFIKMHYTFENGIKIQFDLEKVVEL